MNSLSTLRGEMGVLRREVAGLGEKLAGVSVAEDALLVRGGIEVVGESPLPTVVGDGMIYTDELRCDRAHVQHLRVHGLEVVGDAPVLGPTGSRGPPGYATNTGATGPRGASRFTELEDCPSGYRVGACLVATETGLAFGGLAHSGRSVACRLVRGGPLVRIRNTWCNELGEAIFSAHLEGGTPARVELGVVLHGGDTPVRLDVVHALLGPDGTTSTSTQTLELQPGGHHYQEVRLDPIEPPPMGALLQTTVSASARAYIAHMSATQ